MKPTDRGWGVKQAVNEAFEDLVTTRGVIWWVQKDDVERSI